MIRQIAKTTSLLACLLVAAATAGAGEGPAQPERPRVDFGRLAQQVEQLQSQEPSAPGPNPPGEPASPEARKLVGQLGAEDWETRDKARRELKAMGQTAMPELLEALSSRDAEIAATAAELLEALGCDVKNIRAEREARQAVGGRKYRPGEDLGVANVITTDGCKQMRRVVWAVDADGTPTIVNMPIEEKPAQPAAQPAPAGDPGGLTIATGPEGDLRVAETKDGIEIKFSPRDGAPRTYEAKDRAELKQKQPEVCRLYLPETEEERAAFAKRFPTVRRDLLTPQKPPDPKAAETPPEAEEFDDLRFRRLPPPPQQGCP